MKKIRPNKNRTMKPRNRQNLEVSADAAKVLRTVGEQEAFHFYEAIGKPIGETARNLQDFLDKAKSVKTESLTFHLRRRDFQNWIQKSLGNSKLATELEQISSSSNEDIRTNICETIENHIRTLKESPTTILATEHPTVLLSTH